MARTTYPTEAGIAAAAAILRGGGLVAFPTETVYGLGANALDAAAVRRIFEVKGRPSTSPLIVHADSIAMARSMVAAVWPEKAEALARKFWPGPLSLVLPKRNAIPNEVTAGLQTVGVRVPSHPVAIALIREAGVPVAAPSANRFTHLSPTEARHVQDSLGDRIDVILDGGRTEVGIESTVLSLAGEVPVLLRLGMISQADLEAEIGRVALTAPMPGEDGQAAHPSPGLSRKHYSPATVLLLTAEPPEGRGGYVWWSQDAGTTLRSVRMPANPDGYAREIYSVLHLLDKEGLDFIAVEPPPSTAEWNAIRDRLQRAARQEQE